MPTTADTIAASAQIIASNMMVVHRIADECKTYYTGQVTPDGIVHWLLQFREPAAVQVALRLLENIHFIDESRLGHLLLAAINKIPIAHRESAIFVPAGKVHDSAAHVGYVLSKALGYPEKELSRRLMELTEIEELLKQASPVSSIVFFDDNLTSGIQLKRFFQELYPSFEGEREHVSRPWSQEALERLKTTPIYIVVAVELSEGATDVQTAARELGLSVVVYSGRKDFVKWLEYGGALWASKEKAQAAVDIISKISRDLFADKAGWGDETLNARLLGYGNLQKLTVLQHSTPKSLLPPFWKFGRFDGNEWFPLFADRSEWEKYSARIVNADPSIRALSRMVATGAFGHTAPSNSAVISIEGEPATQLDVNLPDSDSLKRAFDHLVTCLPPTPLSASRLDFMKTAATVAGSALSGVLGVSLPSIQAPTQEQLDQYNQEVDEYVKSINEKWAPKISQAVKNAAKSFSVPLRVYNDGTRKATKTFLRLELPEGLTWFPNRFSFPIPPSVPERPTSPATFKIPSFSSETELRRQWQLKLTSGTRLEEAFDVDADASEIRLSRDRGRTLLSVHFGSILQGTFRDRTVAFLFAEATGQFSVPYKLYCEEVAYPTEGVFILNVRPAAFSPAEVFRLLDFD
ncbi:phosphoribosyltransferase-like protein [Myxococcus sp. Y35]|uniref:phosphoribosyltransferase-like protein n=1 Tax=Pseudomyxococcus flavus TaxID=3115648 RepID=UPI003CF88656